jgi:hypothetical protein
MDRQTNEYGGCVGCCAFVAIIAVLAYLAYKFVTN